MQLKPIYAAILLSAPLWLTGCLSGIPHPLNNPPPLRRTEAVDNYENYNAIPLTKKTLLLNEGFDNNTRNWKVASGTDYTMTVASGELYIGTLSSARQSTISLTDVKETEDFEIETRMRTSSTNSTNGGGSLVWGGSTSSWYFFRVNPYTGALEIGRGTRPSIANTGSITTGMYKVFTVRKVKNLYYYFIDGGYIDKELVNAFYGPAIGFEAGRNTTLWVDYLKVSRLTL
jgi:hypothetical protein